MGKASHSRGGRAGVAFGTVEIPPVGLGFGFKVSAVVGLKAFDVAFAHPANGPLDGKPDLIVGAGESVDGGHAFKAAVGRVPVPCHDVLVALVAHADQLAVALDRPEDGIRLLLERHFGDLALGDVLGEDGQVRCDPSVALKVVGQFAHLAPAALQEEEDVVEQDGADRLAAVAALALGLDVGRGKGCRRVGPADCPLVAGGADHQTLLAKHPRDAVALAGGHGELQSAVGTAGQLEVLKVINATTPDGVGLVGGSGKAQALLVDGHGPRVAAHRGERGLAPLGCGGDRAAQPLVHRCGRGGSAGHAADGHGAAGVEVSGF